MLAALGPPDRRGRRTLGLSCGLIALLMLAWGLLCGGLIVTAEVGMRPVTALVGLAAAVGLALPYLVVILWLDRNEPEPPWLIVTALAWGAFGATSLSLLGNGLLGAVFASATPDPALAAQLTASISAPLVEEIAKGIALVVIYLLFRSHFDNVLDGIIYGALVGLGFAAFENFLYYMKPDEFAGTLVIIWLRGVITSPGTHMCFTAILGATIGMFRVRRSGATRWALPVLGLGLAMFAHFVWNTLTALFVGDSGLLNLFFNFPLAVLVLQLPFVLLVLFTAAFALRHERQLIERYLANERPPVMHPGELERLVPARRRTLNGLRLLVHGRVLDVWRARRRNRLLIALAFEKWHMDAEAAEGGEDARAHAIEVQRLRRVLSGLPALRP